MSTRWTAFADRYADPTDTTEAAPSKNENQRERLLKVALGEFAKRGYEGTTLALVARRCGVTQPLLHYHFGNKENLWREAVQPGLSVHSEHIARVVRDGDPDDAVGALKSICRAFVLFGARNPDLARVLSNEAYQPEQHVREMVMLNGVPILEAFAKVFERAVAAGGVRDMHAEHALLICAGATESYLRYAKLTQIVAGRDQLSEAELESYTESVITICFDGLLSPATA